MDRQRAFSLMELLLQLKIYFHFMVTEFHHRGLQQTLTWKLVGHHPTFHQQMVTTRFNYLNVQAFKSINNLCCMYPSAFGSGGLRAAPEVTFKCVAGHCYYQLSVFLSSFFLLLRLLPLAHFGDTPEGEFPPPLFWHNCLFFRKNK